MKTVLIWDQCGEAAIKFYVLDGDYSHLDKVMINSSNSSEKKQDELNALMYDDNGKDLQVPRKVFPYKAVRNGAKVIVAGFIP